MKRTIIAFVALLLTVAVNAQTCLKKVYNEDIDPIEQIDQAIIKAKSEGKFVICQKRLNNCGRFGFPVFVVLDENGKVIQYVFTL